MEKAIIIDGRAVTFKSTAGILMRYKAQFGKDLFGVLAKLGNVSKDTDGNINVEELDMEVLYNIAWTMAKTADKSIPNPQDWLDSFDEFPIEEVFVELQEMIVHTIAGKKK